MTHSYCSAMPGTELIWVCISARFAVKASGSWRQRVIGFSRDIGLPSSTFPANPGWPLPARQTTQQFQNEVPKHHWPIASMNRSTSHWPIPALICSTFSNTYLDKQNSETANAVQSPPFLTRQI